MADNKKTETAEETLAAKQAELVELEIQAKKLELLEKEANLQDLKDRLDERQLKKDDRYQKFKTNGQSLAATNASEAQLQNRCNHRKGGQGQRGGGLGQGDDAQYAVIKHVMMNGDMWVRCLRCGKTWKPPIRQAYKTEEAYMEAYGDYVAAKNFMTRNSTSTSVVFQWSDNGKHFREQMAQVTLR